MIDDIKSSIRTLADGPPDPTASESRLSRILKTYVVRSFGYITEIITAILLIDFVGEGPILLFENLSTVVILSAVIFVLGLILYIILLPYYIYSFEKEETGDVIQIKRIQRSLFSLLTPNNVVSSLISVAIVMVVLGYTNQDVRIGTPVLIFIASYASKYNYFDDLSHISYPDPLGLSDDKSSDTLNYKFSDFSSFWSSLSNTTLTLSFPSLMSSYVVLVYIYGASFVLLSMLLMHNTVTLAYQTYLYMAVLYFLLPTLISLFIVLANSVHYLTNSYDSGKSSDYVTQQAAGFARTLGILLPRLLYTYVAWNYVGGTVSQLSTAIVVFAFTGFFLRYNIRISSETCERSFNREDYVGEINNSVKKRVRDNPDSVTSEKLTSVGSVSLFRL